MSGVVNFRNEIKVPGKIIAGGLTNEGPESASITVLDTTNAYEVNTAEWYIEWILKDTENIVFVKSEPDITARRVYIPFAVNNKGRKITIVDIDGTSGGDSPIYLLYNGYYSPVSGAYTNVAELEKIDTNFRGVTIVSDGTHWYTITVNGTWEVLPEGNDYDDAPVTPTPPASPVTPAG